jgi:transposase
MSRKRVVELTDDDRARCLEVVRSGSAHARSIMHAQVLLKTDAGSEGPGWTDSAIAEAFGISTVTVSQIRKAMVTEGLAAAVSHYRGPNREYRRKLDGHQEANLIALACSAPPEGHTRWSLRLLSHRMVDLGYVDSISHETVGQVLKKTNCSPGAPCAGASRPARARSS